MRPDTRFNPTRWLAVIALAVFCATAAQAGDLPAAGDGEHLWLIQQAPAPADDKDADPKLSVYHLPADTETYFATKLDPITGELMPRGIAAGDGRLLLVTTQRQLITIRPEYAELLESYVYRQRTLTALPEGCTLLSLAMGDRGPWALVQVQSRELLKQLDQRESKPQGPTDQQILNKALGLPEDLQWDEPVEPAADEDAVGDDGATPSDDEPTPQADAESQAAGEAADDEAEDADEAIEVELPAYRLIHLRRSKWVSSPLPEGFDVPREAALVIRPGDDRPTLLVDRDSAFGHRPALVRYNPVVPVERPDADAAEGEQPPSETEDASAGSAPAWVELETGMQLQRGLQWSATLVNGQIVVAQERFRPLESVTLDAYILRGKRTYAVGYTQLNTGDNARWALFPMRNDIAFLASPAPPPDPSVDQSNRLPILAFLAGRSLDGEPIYQNDQGQSLMMPISEEQPTVLQGNADLFIQILAFITAMFMMVMFYRRAPQQDQLDLPEHLVLASFSRRAIAGMIDLAPGFFLASLIYDVTVSDTLLKFWPGNGIEKAFAAMRPGFVVIGVTLVHTTICEFILARSLGKILMGMYVSDLNGKPAPPMPCLGRALSRAFELFAPLMILVAIISPARQRLGDILAKTTVVMRKPEPIEEENDQ